MIFPLKLQHTAESKVFFFSDMHFFHDPSWDIPLWKKRGFNSVEEHNETLIKRWNDKITNNDVVFLLGDTVFGKGGATKLNHVFNVLNYKFLYLMVGNHGSGFKQIINEIEQDSDGCLLTDKYFRISLFCASKVVYLIPNYYEVIVNSQPLAISHYPILSWNGMSRSSYMLFGHCHHTMKDVPWVKENYLTGKCLDVGFESVGEPQSFDEIKAYMDKQVIIKPDHHDSNTQNPF